MTLRIALILDGSSDAALRFPCEWLLRRHNRDASVEVLPEPKPRPNLKQRILAALKTEPNILLVHRDAEKETWESRRQEIQRAVDSAGMGNVVGVVPVRMTEAWFLIDENAIRMAADNPNGKVALNLPTSNKLENLPDPKGVLFEKLREASELRGRRLKSLDVRERAHRVAELINDYSPLLRLPACRIRSFFLLAIPRQSTHRNSTEHPRLSHPPPPPKKPHNHATQPNPSDSPELKETSGKCWTPPRSKLLAARGRDGVAQGGQTRPDRFTI